VTDKKLYNVAARSPNEEDQTPPELRGCGHPTFVQPDLSPTGKSDGSTGKSVANGNGKNGAVSNSNNVFLVIIDSISNFRCHSSLRE
jgi:hypothetical protein